MNRAIIAIACAITAFTVANLAANADPTHRAGDILTAELAQKILGGPVQANASNTLEDTDMGRTWVSKSNFSSNGTSVGILIRHAASPEDAKSVFNSSKETFSGVDVPGLGVSAYRTKSPPQLNVLKGNDWVIISAGTFSNPDTAKQEALAREILPKLK